MTGGRSIPQTLLMTTTTTTQGITVNTYTTFDDMTDSPEWLGFGYIGGRLYIAADLRAEGDAIVLEHAVRNGWTDENLFAWANGKRGRHFADAVESGDLTGARLIIGA